MSKMSGPRAEKLVVEAQNSLMSKAYRNLRFPGMFCTNKHENQLNIMVTPNNIHVTLQFVNELIKQLRKRGNNLTVFDGRTYVIIQDERMEVCFREKARIVSVLDKNTRRIKYRPTGILCLRVYGYDFVGEKEFDDFNTSLENQIPKLLHYFEARALALKEQRRDWEIIEKRREARQNP